MTLDSARDTMAENAAEVDDLTWQHANEYRERVAQLLSNPEERDADLWEDAFESVGLDQSWAVFEHQELIADFEIAERDLTWQMARATIEATARRQADLELYIRQLLSASEEHATKVKQLRRTDVMAMGKTGIGKDRINAALERRRGNG